MFVHFYRWRNFAFVIFCYPGFCGDSCISCFLSLSVIALISVRSCVEAALGYILYGCTLAGQSSRGNRCSLRENSIKLLTSLFTILCVCVCVCVCVCARACVRACLHDVPAKGGHCACSTHVKCRPSTKSRHIRGPLLVLASDLDSSSLKTQLTIKLWG